MSFCVILQSSKQICEDQNENIDLRHSLINCSHQLLSHAN